MVKEELVKSTSEGDWKSVAGLGLLGVLGSLGLVPALVVVLGVLAVSIILAVLFLPILAAAIVGGAIFFISERAGLRGIKLVAAPVLAAFATLLLFNFTNLTILSLSATGVYNVSSVQGAGAMGIFGDIFGGIFGVASNLVQILQIMLGMIIMGFVLLSLLMFRAIGGGAVDAAVVGLVGAMVTGVAVGDFFDIHIPGLAAQATASGSSVGLLSALIVSAVVALGITYAIWRFDWT